MNPEALQAAIYSRLTNDAALNNLLSRQVRPDGSKGDGPAVYGHVPDAVDVGDKNSENFPYVVIGEDTNIDFDTDTSLGSESTVTIHQWSRFRGRSEVKKIQKAIYDALNRAELTISGRHLVDSIWEFAETTLERDGKTYHGVMRFRVTTEEQ